MEGIVRIVHQHERDLREVLHPKVIKELPTAEEVMKMFKRFIVNACSLDGSDVRLGYFFSSRKRYGEDRDYSTRRSWSIISYPLEGRAKFMVNNRLLNWRKAHDQWGLNWYFGEDKNMDPLFFIRLPRQNMCFATENCMFLFSGNPSDERYLEEVTRQSRVPCLPHPYQNYKRAIEQQSLKLLKQLLG